MNQEDTPLIICKFCNRKYEYNKKAGHTKTHCNSCSVNLRRFKLKERMIEYKGGCCSICGYNKCPTSLIFHHLDPSKKEFQLSGSHTFSWEKNKKELDKCILLCRNCHGELHYQENETKREELSKKLERHITERKPPKEKITKKCSQCKNLFTAVHTNTKYCSTKCAHRDSYRVPHPTPEQLQEDISNMTWVAMGKKYSVSNNAVKKWARKYNLIPKKEPQE